MITVELRLFAGLAEQAGVSNAELSIEAGLNAADLVGALRRAIPEIAEVPVRLAIDGVLIPPDPVFVPELRERSQIVVFPPFGGG